MLSLNTDFWQFVNQNRDADPAALRLKYHAKDSLSFDVDFAILQIECRKKFRKKLSQTLERVPHFIFPSALAGEQSTSDTLAAFHASLTRGNRLFVDLTSGLGIDILHCAPNFARAIALDIKRENTETLAYNCSCADVKNIETHCADCTRFVNEFSASPFDTAFIDPARRASDGSRVFALADCEPNVVAMLPILSKFCHRLIVKMSPMLDITHTIAELPGICRIYAIGTNTECKEIVAVIDFDSSPSQPSITSVTLSHDGTVSEFTFSPTQEAEATIAFGSPTAAQFLYEPSPSLMKAAPFRLISQRFSLTSISANSHIYFCDSKIDSFPGSVMRIVEVLPYSSAVIKRLHRRFPKISVTCRNFDISADNLRAKLGVKDGGQLRLFATKDASEKPMLIVAEPI